MFVERLVVLVVLVVAAALALPKSEEKNDRIFNRELSDKEHFENEHHNPQYDHEAFLGEEAKTFDQLPPEESKRRLGYVFHLPKPLRMISLHHFD